MPRVRPRRAVDIRRAVGLFAEAAPSLPVVTTKTFLSASRPLLVPAYGAGRDSTALLIELHRRGIVPDLILFADTRLGKAGDLSVPSSHQRMARRCWLSAGNSGEEGIAESRRHEPGGRMPEKGYASIYLLRRPLMQRQMEGPAAGEVSQ
jgi:hypothetical protein